MGIDVEKMEAKGDVKGLTKALKDKDETVRGKAAVALDNIDWKPGDNTEKAYYLAAKRKWDDLAKLGKPAVNLLISCLKDNDDVDVLVNAARTLGKIGDVKAIEQLGYCIFSIKAGLNGQMDWDRYETLVPVVAEGLASIGKPAVDQFIKYLKGDTLLEGIPILWALCEIGDSKAAEPVIDWIFKVGPLAPIVPGSFGKLLIFQKSYLSPPDLIRVHIPPAVLSKLLGHYTDVILDIFAWRLATEPGQWDVSRCSEALQRLCAIKSTVSSNILHKILSVDMLRVGFQFGTHQSATEYLDFKPQRDMANDELKRRGKPRYNPSAYLNEDAWRT